ncbi:uncharacterized protein LOC109712350 [Ananas comosus]|uniref:Uncharacterized protein LOC109712350 n=2 Tax=Ananas comosus TaxID=4615 RepID=A0A199V831_ANACO|nr:uncharacterized protein LOC109712350 [Ananas comosus]OAY73234.1 hypothetical protein ACMD2_02820 [Ananas comosus]CAD1841615.1 unnamed protein product [Ananas comosus var. bracteatus]
MGWKWVDDEEPSKIVSSGRGFGDVGEVVNPNPRSREEDHCSTRRVVRSRCRTEEVEPGRFIKKCERTQETLRDCIGRPAEVVESETEHSEEDVTDEVKRGSFSLESPTIVPFPFPGLQSDIEALERGFFGGLSNFLEEAERMTSEFFKSFGVPSSCERETSPFGQRRQLEKENPTNPTEPESPPYSEFASQVREV